MVGAVRRNAPGLVHAELSETTNAEIRQLPGQQFVLNKFFKILQSERQDESKRPIFRGRPVLVSFEKIQDPLERFLAVKQPFLS